jgi:hypothetical protein
MFHRSLLALSLTLLIASSAYAATIFITPALEPPNDGQLQCQVVNGHTTQAIEVVVQILDLNGTVVLNSVGNVTTLAPFDHYAASSGETGRYCIVTLVHGPKAKVRVSVAVRTASGATLAALEGHP